MTNTATTQTPAAEPTWAVDPRFVLKVVPGEGVFAIQGETAALLSGRAYRSVVPLIDGTRTSGELVDALEGTTSAAEVYFVVQRLRQRGYIVPAAPPEELAERAWWSEMGDGTAADRVHAGTVQIHVAAGVDPNVVAQTERDLELADVRLITTTGDDALFGPATPDLLLVFAGDYTEAELASVNTQCMATGVPWLLVRPDGRRPWLGPLVKPGETACWQCLMVRRRALRRVHTFLALSSGEEGLSMPIAGGPASAAVVAGIVQIEVVKILGGLPQPVVADAPAGSGVLTELDLADWSVTRHVVVRRPQCSVCGDPTPAPSAPVVPVADRATSTDDGGFRTVQAAETYRRFRHHVSPITGIATTLEEEYTPDPNMHVWFSGTNFGLPARDIMHLRRSLRATTAGKGTTADQARIGALCEALERYSSMANGEELRIRGTLRGLGDRAVHPNECMLYSDEQFDRAAEENARIDLARRSWFRAVPARFDADAEVDWTPLWSLTDEREVFLPSDYVYYGRGDGLVTGLAGDSNGCAAGNTLTEAILQGFFEIVERDCIAMWWYNRVRRPAVDIASIGDPWADEIVAGYRRRGREVWALDLTNDLGIPTVAVLSRRVDAPTERVLMAFGSHLDGRVAVLRGLAELNQMSPSSDEPPGIGDDFDSELEHWLRTANVENQPYLLPDPDAPVWRLSDHPSLAGRDLAEDVDICRQHVERVGLKMLVLDQTRADVGLPVAKVVVPGLRPFWQRLAPGRLYDVPVQLGWLDAPTPEAELNPIAMFL